MSMITPVGGGDTNNGGDARNTRRAFCTNCGKEAVAEDRFCAGCGVALPGLQIQAPPLLPALPVRQSQQPLYAQYAQMPPPQAITQQVTIVQSAPHAYCSASMGAGAASLGCFTLFALVCFPLWPITIPILIIWTVVWSIMSLCTPRDSITYRID